MEEIFEFTKAQLTEAFKIWNTDFLGNPESFDPAITADTSAERQAEILLDILVNRLE